MLGKTSDGHSWTPQGGLRQGGFACEGVISPLLRMRDSADFVYDVLVIGAGYAGLSAARDLTSAGESGSMLGDTSVHRLERELIWICTGRSVLLIEGRDRVGGRSYTVDEDGI